MRHKIVRTMLLVIILVILAIDMQFIMGQPVGANIAFNESVNVTPAPGAEIRTAGGSFTTLVLNVTQQTPRWKAYVGNVSGDLVLADGSNLKIYDWDVATITGEVYASRNDSITWGSIKCLNNSILASEESYLNISTDGVDSINRTFNETTHKFMWIGGTLIANSSCRAIATYVNDTAQAPSESATFQEVLLEDGTNLIYATIIESDESGYDVNKTFDFQMIVAEDEFAAAPTPYYFYAEIG
ncbi:hypothetical protein ACFLTH_13085 [Bacteroidota bacterium]